MEVTGHYYDDLAPRFGLSAELISQLRTHHILYDEDEHGCFYQLYTRLFEKRFCFEFVQRAGSWVWSTKRSNSIDDADP